MASETEIRAAISKLRPYLSQAMREADVDPCDSANDAGEPYLTLIWLLDCINLPGVHAPSAVLLQASKCLTDEDKEEYKDILK